MASEYVRDSAMTALILGFFASSWFGWAQERPPDSWRPFLIAGAVVSVLIAAIGGVFAIRHWSDGSVLATDDSYARFGIIVGIEFGLAAAGAVVLALTGHADLTACWICLVVGVHFWPLAPVLRDPPLYALGAAMVAVAIGAFVLSRNTSIAPSALTGVGAGVALLVFAAGSLVTTLTWM